MKLAVIGAGRMGGPIAQKLSAAGHELTVLVRRPDAGSAAERAGLRWAETIAATVRDADVVFSVVLRDEQVRAVCLGEDGAIAGMKRGAVIVQHTTCDPATLELLGVAGEERGIRILDAALSGGPHDIAAGTLTLWAGGDATLLEALRPLLASYASPILHVGALGHGQRVKLVNNALFVAQLGLAVDAVRLGGALGLEEQPLLAALQHGSAASRALGVVARGGSTDALARLSEWMRKDVDVVKQVAARAGADLGIIGAVLSSDPVEKTILRHHSP
jgi:3-hydroxyisobutyrate dehydrogenase-like beta-hydroxyacid dehydrogenase